MSGQKPPIAAHVASLTKARKDIKERIPADMAAAAGGVFDKHSNTIELPYRGQSYTVNPQDGTIEPSGHSVPLSTIEQAVVLHYLMTATGRAPAGKLVSYREFRKVGASGNNGLECDRLDEFFRIYDPNPKKLLELLDVLPGAPVNNGDAAIRVDILPKVPVTFVFWAGEEGIPPEITVLYDAYALDYLPLEDLAGIASFAIDHFVELYESK